MRKSGFVLLAVLAAATYLCNGQDDSIAANDLTFRETLASRAGDARLYFVVGNGWLLGIRSKNSGQFITDWLAAHPSATVIPISRSFDTNTRTKQTTESVYIWIEDGGRSLNVDSVRAGIFPASEMRDMVDTRKGVDELLKDPKMASAKAEADKERAEAPQDRVERLITEDDYIVRMRRIDEAEALARKEKLGVWSDAKEEERQAQGYP
jgi:hypothetical protein